MDNKKYMDGLTRSYGKGAPNKYQYIGDKCVKDCKNFKAYETHHHKDCPFYPGSMSERYDNLEAALNNKGSDAVEFAEWIRENRFYVALVSQELKWVARDVRNKVLGYYGESTSEQLYEQFLKTKHPVTK